MHQKGLAIPQRTRYHTGARHRRTCILAMRIIVTADLHYRPAKRDAYLAFAEWVRQRNPDCFIIAGDIGHPLRLFQRGLQLFRDLTCPRAVIAGNHDVYRSDYDSRTLWEAWLPRITRDEGFIWLEDDVLTLGNVGVCGTMAWYDYSSRAPHLTLGDHEYRVLKGSVNHDADYVDWPWSDRAMARYLAKGFAGRLGNLVNNPLVSRILVVTHVPIIEIAVPRYPESDFWSLMRAYMGNFTLGKLVLDQPKVSHIVSGHLHRAGRWTIAGRYGPVECHIVGSAPGEPTAVELTL
ncbi:MAG: metallophosphoesterase [Roseiflexus sp.]|nr:metallophosphoesterase [Roseiflexus sp.]